MTGMQGRDFKFYFSVVPAFLFIILKTLNKKIRSCFTGDSRGNLRELTVSQIND